MSAETESIKTLKQELKKLVIVECDKDVPVESISDDEPIINGPLELDSLDGLQICLAVKNRYGVRIEGGPDSRKALKSISALANIIVERAQ